MTIFYVFLDLKMICITRILTVIREVSPGRTPLPPPLRPDPDRTEITQENFLRRQMVKIFLMGCLKKYFKVLKFSPHFGSATGG